MTAEDQAVAGAVLRLASALVSGIQDGLAARGFDDVRPAHGFVFARISGSPATATEIARHLGVSKQAAAQLVTYLVDKGYVIREADPNDGRAQLVCLTDHGRACTEAADAAADAVVARWRAEMSAERFHAFGQALNKVAVPGRLRPSW